jgi:hypothetical protein
MDDATSTVQMRSVLSQLIREELSLATHTLDVYTQKKSSDCGYYPARRLIFLQKMYFHSFVFINWTLI